VLRAINLRKLAAIDVALLGYKLIFAEYAAGVILAIGLGLFVIFRSHSVWQIVLGLYLICLGINYVPMLAYTIAIGNRGRAQEEIADELIDRGRATSKYRRQSLVLLVPLLAAALALRPKRPVSPETKQNPR
jgi:hypothetical protein